MTKALSHRHHNPHPEGPRCIPSSDGGEAEDSEGDAEVGAVGVYFCLIRVAR